MKYKIKSKIIADKAHDYAEKRSKGKCSYMEIRSSFRAGMFEAMKILNENIRESEEEFCDCDIVVPLKVGKTFRIKGKIIDKDQNSPERT